MTVADIQTKSESWNMRVIGHHDLNGHGDGMQLLKHGRYVYLAHLGTSPMALSILDVADPTDPRLVTQMPHAPNTHAHKVQIAGDILIQPFDGFRGPLVRLYLKAIGPLQRDRHRVAAKLIGDTRCFRQRFLLETWFSRRKPRFRPHLRLASSPRRPAADIVPRR